MSPRGLQRASAKAKTLREPERLRSLLSFAIRVLKTELRQEGASAKPSTAGPRCGCRRDHVDWSPVRAWRGSIRC